MRISDERLKKVIKELLVEMFNNISYTPKSNIHKDHQRARIVRIYESLNK
jgi:hypothetical protein